MLGIWESFKPENEENDELEDEFLVGGLIGGGILEEDEETGAHAPFINVVSSFFSFSAKSRSVLSCPRSHLKNK
jgi:hypothetical protein